MFKVETCRTLHWKAVIKGEEEKPLDCGFVLSQAAERVSRHSKPHCSAVKLFIRLCQVQKQKCCNAKIHTVHERWHRQPTVLMPTYFLEHGDEDNAASFGTNSQYKGQRRR